MIVRTISDEMMYLGGGNWVLQRMLVVNGKTKFCRMSSDMFVYSDVPLEYHDMDVEDIASEDY